MQSFTNNNFWKLYFIWAPGKSYEVIFIGAHFKEEKGEAQSSGATCWKSSSSLDMDRNDTQIQVFQPQIKHLFLPWHSASQHHAWIKVNRFRSKYLGNSKDLRKDTQLACRCCLWFSLHKQSLHQNPTTHPSPTFSSNSARMEQLIMELQRGSPAGPLHRSG